MGIKNKNKGNPMGETARDREYYAKGRDAGLEHKSSSKETKELFKSMGDKFDSLAEKVNDILIKMEGLPQAILEKTDGKYACKDTESELKELKKTIDNRNYDWLKYLLTAIGSIAVGVLIAKLK